MVPPAHTSRIRSRAAKKSSRISCPPCDLAIVDAKRNPVGDSGLQPRSVRSWRSYPDQPVVSLVSPFTKHITGFAAPLHV